MPSSATSFNEVSRWGHLLFIPFLVYLCGVLVLLIIPDDNFEGVIGCLSEVKDMWDNTFTDR